jgi:nicotinamide mononucleotide transporter
MNAIRFDNLEASFRALKWYEWVMITVMVAVAGWTMVNAFLDPSTSNNPPWLTVVNFASSICGILCIFFTAKASISNCVFGILNTLTYLVYLAYWHIYGTMCLEAFVYLPMGLIQWYIWTRHRDGVQQELTLTRRLTLKQDILVFSVVAVAGIGYYLVLDAVGGNVAILDAYTVSMGIIAVVLSAFRFREQYILWLVTDIVAVAMFLVLEDPVYLTKKTIYLIMAFVGIMNWWKLNRERNASNE